MVRQIRSLRTNDQGLVTTTTLESQRLFDVGSGSDGGPVSPVATVVLSWLLRLATERIEEHRGDRGPVESSSNEEEPGFWSEE